LTYNKKVIQFPKSLPLWTFEDYVEGDSNPIEDWYLSELTDDSRFMFESVLKNCQKIENPSKWQDSRGYLSGECEGHQIWELGFKADNKQYRILGVFSKQKRKRAILLLGCYHKQKRYTPSNALATAVKRKKDLTEGRANTIERKIDTNQ
jgi:phage-related protein